MPAVRCEEKMEEEKSESMKNRQKRGKGEEEQTMHCFWRREEEAHLFHSIRNTKEEKKRENEEEVSASLQ